MNVVRWLKTWGVTSLLVFLTTFLLTRDAVDGAIVAAVCLGSGLYHSW